VLFGPAYKGIPLAVTTAIALARDHGHDVGFCFDRKEAKDHGEGGLLVGHQLRDGDRVVIVEDVTTAGTSVRATVPLLRAEADVEVVGLVVGVDRRERGPARRSARPGGEGRGAAAPPTNGPRSTLLGRGVRVPHRRPRHHRRHRRPTWPAASSTAGSCCRRTTWPASPATARSTALADTGAPTLAADLRFADLAPDDPRWVSAFPVLVQLRTHLDRPTFDAILTAATAQGLVYTTALLDDRCVGLAGWRVIDTTHVVRKLYVDDLVTDAAHRSRGWGRAARPPRGARCGARLPLPRARLRGAARGGAPLLPPRGPARRQPALPPADPGGLTRPVSGELRGDRAPRPRPGRRPG
jgi:hypothetical protein